MSILTGDIGGTNTRLALFECSERIPELVTLETFRSADFSDLAAVLTAFLDRTGESCQRACFGLAGPIAGRVMRLTNLPWVVDANSLEDRFGFESVSLINDLEAVGWGLPLLESTELRVINQGAKETRGNQAVIAAGTGLGEAGLFWDGSQHRSFACEGGHATFSPTSDEDWELRRFLGRTYEHVSWERVVSGPGLAAIYEFVRQGYRRLGDGVDVESVDVAAAIVDAATRGVSEVAEMAVRIFVRLYGSEAGNLALKTMATDGVFLAGGIAPKIVDWLADGTFMYGFTSKGRMRPLLEAMPVSVVLNDRVALLGAARRAALGDALQ
jgi:glucokinase